MRWLRCRIDERNSTMSERIKVADLPEFDAARFLGNEKATAAYLRDIVMVNDLALLVSALGDIARARGIGTSDAQ